MRRVAASGLRTLSDHHEDLQDPRLSPDLDQFFKTKTLAVYQGQRSVMKSIRCIACGVYPRFSRCCMWFTLICGGVGPWSVSPMHVTQVVVYPAWTSRCVLSFSQLHQFDLVFLPEAVIGERQRTVHHNVSSQRCSPSQRSSSSSPVPPRRGGSYVCAPQMAILIRVRVQFPMVLFILFISIARRQGRSQRGH